MSEVSKDNKKHSVKMSKSHDYRKKRNQKYSIAQKQNVRMPPLTSSLNFIEVTKTHEKNSSNENFLKNNLTTSSRKNPSVRKIEEKKMFPNEMKKYEYIYSPRTTFIKEKFSEEQLYSDLGVSFDPLSIKIVKKYFKERLGSLDKKEFITIIKNILISWHPNLPNRDQILIKLLNRLFNEIDINSNNSVQWEEFTNYIVHSGNNIFKKKNDYNLKLYTPSKIMIDPNEIKDVITYAFYIKKYSLLGLVFENKSIITFFDTKTLKKNKARIDIKETQKDIDEMEFDQLDLKARETLMKQEEQKILKIKIHLANKQKKNNFSPSKLNLNIENNLNILNNENKGNYYTPSIEKNKIKIKIQDFYKKLTILCTCFVEEYDILFVSASNNIITAWKYIELDFKNINRIGIYNNNYMYEKSMYFNEEDASKINIFIAELPQYCMDWDPLQKLLYSGQNDGKILIWNKKYSNYTGELDFKKVKEKHENLINDKNNSKDLENLEKNFNILSKKKTKINQNPIISMNEKIISGIKLKESILRDGVNCIKVLGQMQMLAAGYYNGTIIIWDTLLKDSRKYYNDQNTYILQIEFDEIRKLIFTCGFDHDIFIYDPYIDNTCVYKLKGHNWSVNSIICNEYKNEFISIDIYGNIKLWDLKNYYNYQNINISDALNHTSNFNSELAKKENSTVNNSQLFKKLTSNQKMIMLTKENKIFIYGGKEVIYDAESYSLPDLCDSKIVLGCIYLEKNYEFVTVCSRKIKIWNAFNGKVTKIYDHFLINNSCEITTFCCDDNKKKLYLGDSGGHIFCISIHNGKLIKSYKPHDKEIIYLFYSSKNKVLISLNTDNIINIFDDKFLLINNKNNNINEHNDIIPDILIEHSFEITAMDYIETYSRLILGSNEGEFRFYDIVLSRFDSSGGEMIKKNFKKFSINTIYAIENFPLCVIFNNVGKGKFLIIPPNEFKYTSFGDFPSNNKNEKKNNQIWCISRIISCFFNYNKKKLYCGDINGQIKVYSLKEILNIFDNCKKNENQDFNLTKETIEKLKESNVENLFFFEAHKEKIRQITILNEINPEILITTGNDRKVKLFYADDGKYIDELNQATEKYNEIPIGIIYFYLDPFVSKKENNNPQRQMGIIYRKNLKFKKSNKLLEKLRNENANLYSYCNKVTELNAFERLYLLTKGTNINCEQSTSWNLHLDLELVKKKEKEKLTNLLKEIESMDKTSLFSNFEKNTCKKYNDTFFTEMKESNVNEYTDKLYDKIRLAKLINSKIISSEKNKEISPIKKPRIVNFETEYNYVYNKERENFRKKVYSTFKSNISSNYKYETKKFKTTDEWFNNYQKDFDKNLNALENSIETKLNFKYFDISQSTSYNATYNYFNKKKSLPHIKIDYSKSKEKGTSTVKKINVGL